MGGERRARSRSARGGTAPSSTGSSSTCSRGCARTAAATTDVALAGASLGAFHAANFALRHADLFPRALCLSGVYDIAQAGWGERGDAVYFHNPMDYVSHLHGDHLDWLRSRVRLTLVVGQGMWEDTTGALHSTHAFASLLGEKGIPHELDVWGHDVAHDWPAWRAQLVHHLPRLLS